MKNEITVRKTKVNWLKIINLALKRKDWGKTHTLYTCNEITIKANLKLFDFSREIGTFRITTSYIREDIEGNKEPADSSFYLDYHMRNFSIEEFKELAIRRILTKLKTIEDWETLELAEEQYKNLHTYYWNVTINDIKAYGYENQLESIREMPDAQADIMMNALEKATAKDMNKEYDKLIIDYCATPIGMPSIQELITEITDELEDDTD